VIFSLTPRYTAVALVAVGNRAPSVTTGIEATVEGNIVQAPQNEATLVNTQVDYLRSRPVAERAMNYLGLWDLPEFDPWAQPHGSVGAARTWIVAAIARFRGFVSGRTGRSSSDAAVDQEAVRREQAIDILLSKLTVDAEKDSRIIIVQFEDSDRKRFAAAANAVADQYVAR
jgi:uncharacterized protein involved in exopolysaccharide biosynthesis